MSSLIHRYKYHKTVLFSFFLFSFLHCYIFLSWLIYQQPPVSPRRLQKSATWYVAVTPFLRPCLSVHALSVVLLAQQCHGMRPPCRCHMCECAGSWPRQQTHEARETLNHSVQRNHTFLTYKHREKLEDRWRHDHDILYCTSDLCRLLLIHVDLLLWNLLSMAISKW